jgi:peptidylprolyl isomerase
MNSKTAVIGLGVVVLVALILVGRNLGNNSSVNKQAAISAAFQNMQTNPSGLQWKDVTVGTGAEVKTGSTVSVHYTGTLTNGTKFDSSYDRGEPFIFTIGAGQVIPGWEEGLLGMKMGGKRELMIPPTLAYGSRDLGVIPSNSTLQFVVEVVDVK